MHELTVLTMYVQPSRTGRALDQNFVFASLDDAEKQILCNAMETVTVDASVDLITQGKYVTEQYGMEQYVM